MWLKKIHSLTVLENPQLPDWRHFGQNSETIQFLYLQRCRTPGAISSNSTFIIRHLTNSFPIKTHHRVSNLIDSLVSTIKNLSTGPL